MTEEKAGFRFSRNGLKHLAMLTMVLNHVASGFLAPGTLHEVFRVIGYFTAPVMCWLMAAGFRHTASRKNYGGRLFVFACLSQLPYMLYFGPDAGISMMGTLFLCFLILCARHSRMGVPLKVLLQALLVCATVVCDWSVMAPAGVIVFDAAMDQSDPDRRHTYEMLGFGMMGAMMVVFSVAGAGAVMTLPELGWAHAGALGPVTAGIACLGFYDSARRVRPGARYKLSQYYFYAFYPAHLLVLSMIRLLVRA